ncbi:hypothetical protein [Aliivibrio fischeri]|uniref:hypothetical protein n=1 Tax=Aliivibrio fischeri TaxID=668 RepID=UPI001F165E03|nr:hypothetical protein [Aliivibrio fischeri]MCE7553920.1 hypothetical protein [Aliivibrio fischeri]MCE7561228.1 hypothetical protein [Aliivibrio fischeri]MCE7568636.1 hypothetical protein [Aliivibrio fischeri]
MTSSLFITLSPCTALLVLACRDKSQSKEWQQVYRYMAYLFGTITTGVGIALIAAI